MTPAAAGHDVRRLGQLEGPALALAEARLVLVQLLEFVADGAQLVEVAAHHARDGVAPQEEVARRLRTDEERDVAAARELVEPPESLAPRARQSASERSRLSVLRWSMSISVSSSRGAYSSTAAGGRAAPPSVGKSRRPTPSATRRPLRRGRHTSPTASQLPATPTRAARGTTTKSRPRRGTTAAPTQGPPSAAWIDGRTAGNSA